MSCIGKKAFLRPYRPFFPGDVVLFQRPAERETFMFRAFPRHAKERRPTAHTA